MGLLFTAAEVVVWKDRKDNGPFKVTGDYATNSTNGWTSILSNADEIVADPTLEHWVGDGDLVTRQEKGSAEPNDEGIKLVDCAFAYVVTDDNSYRDAALTALLAQVAEPMTDFTNTVRWENYVFIASNPGFVIAEWAIRMLTAYDFIRDGISAGNRTTIEDWLQVLVGWFHLELNAMEDDYYSDRSIGLLGTWEEEGYWATPRSDGRTSHLNGYPLANACGWISNRKGAEAMLIGMGGAYFNNTDWKNNGKWFFQGWMRYAIYPDGTCAEMYRSYITSKESGFIYTGAMIDQMIGVADALARTGDTSLYDFTTSEGAGNSEGGPKDLLLVMKGLSKYVSRTWPDDPRYPQDATPAEETPEYIIDGYIPSTGWHATKDFYMSQGNLYYQDSDMTDSYLRTLTGGFPSGNLNSNPWKGTARHCPDKLFMYALMEDNAANPYLSTAQPITPNPYRRLRGRGAFQLNSKYITP